MNDKNRNNRINTTLKISVIILMILMIVFEFVDFQFFEHVLDNTMITNSLLRFLGGAILMVMLINFGHRWIFQFKKIGKSLLIIIPALVISINNFPIIAFFDGRAVLTEPLYRVFLFLIECLSVGFFEEIIFRGIILLFFVEKFSNIKHGIFISIVTSSFIFGFIHLFNLLGGASFGDTFLQIGYSFLVGMLWAILFLKTRNLWLIMILHATFNFFGQVMFYLGTVNGRYDIYTIMITIGLALVVAFYSLTLYQQVSRKPIFDNEMNDF